MNIQQRRHRALSADYSHELAFLARQAVAHLSMLEQKVKITSQPLAPLGRPHTPSDFPNMAPLQRHQGLAGQLRRALNDSGISPPSPSPTPRSSVKNDSITVVHESVNLSNRYDILADDLDMVVDAAADIPVVRKRRPSGDSRVSDHSPRSRAPRQASLKRVKTRTSEELPHEALLATQKEGTSEVSELFTSTPSTDSVVEVTTQAMRTDEVRRLQDGISSS